MPSTEITALWMQIWSKLGTILEFLDSIRNGYVSDWLQLGKAHWNTYKFRERDGTVETSSILAI